MRILFPELDADRRTIIWRAFMYYKVRINKLHKRQENRMKFLRVQKESIIEWQKMR